MVRDRPFFIQSSALNVIYCRCCTSGIILTTLTISSGGKRKVGHWSRYAHWFKLIEDWRFDDILFQNVAMFHLEKLVPDGHFQDGTLVVSPCNSPEQRPITFGEGFTLAIRGLTERALWLTLGCAHSQQLIWELFGIIEKGFAASGDRDTAFLEGTFILFVFLSPS